MCVVNHLGIPCPKCGAPGLWRQKQQSYERALLKLAEVADYVRSLPDDCPLKAVLEEILSNA